MGKLIVLPGLNFQADNLGAIPLEAYTPVMDADLSDYIAAVPVSIVEKIALNYLITDLKSAAVYDKVSGIYPMLGATASDYARNVKADQAILSVVGAPVINSGVAFSKDNYFKTNIKPGGPVFFSVGLSSFNPNASGVIIGCDVITGNTKFASILYDFNDGAGLKLWSMGAPAFQKPLSSLSSPLPSKGVYSQNINPGAGSYWLYGGDVLNTVSSTTISGTFPETSCYNFGCYNIFNVGGSGYFEHVITQSGKMAAAIVSTAGLTLGENKAVNVALTRYLKRIGRV